MRFILALAALAMASTALANGGGDHDDPWHHPVCVLQGCAVPGADGADGNDGRDGTDGRDGVDGADGTNGTNGVDGTNGLDGLDGINGADGTDGTNGTNGVDGRNGRNGVDGINGRDGVVDELWKTEIARQLAITAAMNAYLPRDANSRITLGAATVGGHRAFGIGYAFVSETENQAAVTFAVGKSGGAVAFQVGFGFEF